MKLYIIQNKTKRQRKWKIYDKNLINKKSMEAYRDSLERLYGEDYDYRIIEAEIIE